MNPSQFAYFDALVMMIPDTRYSLISRLSDGSDQDAWAEFESAYRPVVYQAARKHGLQDADSLDLVQQVMISIARALKQRPHDQQRAKFLNLAIS
ncbi:MAG: hypothetical protein U0930_05840 [Pirellulales bacterium]